MHMISYISDVMVQPQQIETKMVNIVKTAHANNMAAEITGVLFFEKQHFHTASRTLCSKLWS